MVVARPKVIYSLPLSVKVPDEVIAQLGRLVEKDNLNFTEGFRRCAVYAHLVWKIYRDQRRRRDDHVEIDKTPYAFSWNLSRDVSFGLTEMGIHITPDVQEFLWNLQADANWETEDEATEWVIQTGSAIWGAIDAGKEVVELRNGERFRFVLIPVRRKWWQRW